MLAAAIASAWVLGCADDGDGDPDGAEGPTACEEYERSHDLLASCELVIPDCPETLDEFLASVGAAASMMVLEGDGLREVRDWPNFDGKAFSFAEDGALAGYQAWNDVAWGPCEPSKQAVYERGQLLGDVGTSPPSIHRCGLAEDALTTGVLCDCTCPEPPPPEGVYAGAAACLTTTPWPACKPSFAEQRDMAANVGAPMRSGCGVRTITLEALDCSYDDGGTFVGGQRHRSEDPRDECAGVVAYVSGMVPPACAEDTICYFGSSVPSGEMPCAWED
jgi:hypothetical protein